jgi:hypothetical protein
MFFQDWIIQLPSLDFWKVKGVIVSRLEYPIIKGLLWKCFFTNKGVSVSRLEYSIFERLALEVLYHQQWRSAFQD